MYPKENNSLKALSSLVYVLLKLLLISSGDLISLKQYIFRYLLLHSFSYFCLSSPTFLTAISLFPIQGIFIFQYSPSFSIYLVFFDRSISSIIFGGNIFFIILSFLFRIQSAIS